MRNGRKRRKRAAAAAGASSSRPLMAEVRSERLGVLRLRAHPSVNDTAEAHLFNLLGALGGDVMVDAERRAKSLAKSWSSGPERRENFISKLVALSLPPSSRWPLRL